MQTRFLKRWKGLFTAVLVVGLALLPVAGTNAAPDTKVGGGSGSLSASQPDTDGFKQRVLYPRTNYVWPYATGPVYAPITSADGFLPGVYHTAVGSFDLTRGVMQIPGELRGTVRLGEIPAQHFVLAVAAEAFADGTWDALRQEIVSQGGAVQQAEAGGIFLVRLTAGALSALQARPGVLAVEPYHAAFKLSPGIGRAPLADPLKATSEVYSLQALLFPGEDANVVAQAIARLGGNVTGVRDDSVLFDMHRGKLAQVAALEPVMQVFENVPYYPHGEETTTCLQTGRYNGGAIPYHDAGVRGDGNGVAGAPVQTLMVLDSGISLDAGDMSHTRTSSGYTGTAPTNVVAGHRKVKAYTTTSAFGGSGDLLGCDDPIQGGFTHGHLVAATAAGNGTAVAASYGAGWTLQDNQGNPWKVDGVAPRALVVMYDADQTPSSNCSDPLENGLAPGDVFTSPNGGSLGEAYATYGARTANFSWGGGTAGVYGGTATDVDAFIFEKGDAMVFISAGNEGQNQSSGEPAPNTISDPATAKNAIVVGATGNVGEPDNGANQEDRAAFSSIGPANAASNRVAPILMAPGTDFGLSGGNMGIDSEYSCRSSDNDQANVVECDKSEGVVGTSFSSPAAAGAGVLVRDYYFQGLAPDGTSTDPGNSADQVTNLSGALVKAVLVASADFVGGQGVDIGGNLTKEFRFNNEQGYGRIQLNNALPLATYPGSPTGIVTVDGVVTGSKSEFGGTLDGAVEGSNATTSSTIKINDRNQELRCGLAWVEAAGNTLSNNLNLELQAPSGKLYLGNFFTEDVNGNRVLDANEDCDADTKIDDYIWSPVTNQAPNNCPALATRIDSANPTEAVFLSPDPAGDGIADNPSTPANEGADNQIEVGDWTVRVKSGTLAVAAQKYALVCSGGIAVGSSIRLDDTQYVCNHSLTATVTETDEAADPGAGLTTSEIAGRVVFQVLDTTGAVVDTETGISFTKPDAAALKFVSSTVTLSDGTAHDPGNGILDVRSGFSVKVIYKDEENGVPNAGLEKFNSAAVDCAPAIGFGGVTWTQFGQDSADLVSGGCEKDKRGKFTFGFPDRYMDAGERVNYRIAFQSTEVAEDLHDAQVALRCVLTDSNSPSTCKPGTTDCADPNRLDNPACTQMTILDPQKSLGLLPAGVAVSANFDIQMADPISGTPEVEMVLGVSAKKSGKTVESYVVTRQKLNVDEVSTFYSTDFPTGGSRNEDWNNNEQLEDPTYKLGDVNWREDYRDETLVFGDLTAGNTRNTGIRAPWHFDSNNGAFLVGINPLSTTTPASVIANWGEDKNFNNVRDSGEDRDPVNNSLDNNWSTLGGCGWQTRPNVANSVGGVWHTGTIFATSNTCTGTTARQCEETDTIAFPQAVPQSVWEMLLTPKVRQVNTAGFCSDTGAPCDAAPGSATPCVAPGVCITTNKVEFTNWAWNMAMDIETANDIFLYELDTDTTKLKPADLYDGTVFNGMGGPHGTVTGGNAPITDGFPTFGNMTGTATSNGTLGNNRHGKNPCVFEQAGANRKTPYGLARPKDDDVANGYCVRVDAVPDKSKSCTVATQAADCAPLTVYTGTCSTTDAGVDEYVTFNGPLRNYDMSQINGLDMRFFTFEDIYGPSGVEFQGSIGYEITSPTTSSGTLATPSWGISIDDMVLEWREFNLGPDVTTCNGACATITLSSTNFFEGNSLLDVGVLDASPYDAANPKNDCNFDADYLDATDDTDCNDNGIQDLAVLTLSEAEARVLPNPDGTKGEPLYLDRVGATDEYRGKMPLSVSLDVNGVLFVRPSGTSAPFVRVRYEDRNDGTGTRCQSDIDPAKAGVLEDSTAVFVPSGTLIVSGYRLVATGANGDGDGVADPGETVDAFLTISNKTGRDLEGVAVRLSTNDPDIDCVVQPFVSMGSMAEDEIRETAVPFTFHVSNSANRATVNEDRSALFSVTASSNLFDGLRQPQQIVMDLDLDITGGTVQASPFSEGFNSGFGQFVSNSLDLGKASTTLSNGYRCQYNDPDFAGSNSFGQTFCYVGQAAGNPFDWHWHSTAAGGIAPDGGRSFEGSASIHFGRHNSGGDPDLDTYSLKQLDAIESVSPINLGYLPLSAGLPELSFKHQVDLVICGDVNCDGRRGPDRAIVSLRLQDNAGNPVGDWTKITPYENIYDIQATDNYINCLFDPIDDGNDEDDYFDPTDPNRRLGPSSTCYPEFSFAHLGQAVWNAAPTPTDTGYASDGPGLDGAIPAGNTTGGTWVQSKFNLGRYAGRRMKLRFLVTSIEVDDVIDHQTLFEWNENNNPFPNDEGWYIDDIQVSNVLSSPATVSVDADNPANYPASCAGNACNTVTASLTADPATALTAPGQVVELSAGDSSSDRCVNGTLQYQFWNNVNNNGVLGDAGDVLLRDWTDNSVFLDAPSGTTNYGVRVRCSALTSCVDDALLTVVVNCPSTGTAVGGPFAQSVSFSNKTTVAWTSSATIDAVRGDLNALRSSGGNFTGTVDTCLQNNLTGTSFTDATTPAVGFGKYYLVRESGAFCNAPGSYSTGNAKEAAGRDSEIKADPDACQ